MSNIETVTQHLVDTVSSVSAFGGRVGLAVGGQDLDPINRELTRPAAWVIYIGDDQVSGNTVTPCSTVKMNFIVKILVDYDNEASLIATHLPLLHQVVQAVQGGQPVTGAKWLYEGQGLEELTDRMVWNQQYSITLGIS